MTKKESDTDALLAQPALFEMQSTIVAIQNNNALFREQNFESRVEALDFLEFEVIYRIEDLLLKTAHSDQLHLLKLQAEKLKFDLEAINVGLFKKLRADIRAAGYRGEAFKNLVREYVDWQSVDPDQQVMPGYDNLDILINGLFPFDAMPEQTLDLDPEMVYFQKTPARIIFELVEKVQTGAADVLYDLGSGLGQVVILVNLLTGIKVKGIEFEPTFCEHAWRSAGELNLSNVQFTNTDARLADYSGGTLFFMFTPFTGTIMQDVLDKLKHESLTREIKVITYGPCTATVAQQTWLSCAETLDDNVYKLAVFRSAAIN
ncbi:MAG: hypothetical protein ACXVAY_01655 [Mucilaginibacter sp.]